MENLKISAVIKQPRHVEFVFQMNSREMAKQLAMYELDVSAGVVDRYVEMSSTILARNLTLTPQTLFRGGRMSVFMNGKRGNKRDR